MLKSLKKSIISLPNLAKTLIIQHNILIKVLKMTKKSKNKRVFSGFNGLKSSYTSMEFSNQLKLVFKFIDVNDDGKISTNELSEILMCFGHEKSKVIEEASKMLQFMDSNGDGYVDLNEYMDVVMMSDYDNDNDNDNDVECDDNVVYYHGDLEDEVMDAFNVFDIDKNGLISANDLKHVLKKLGFDNCGVKECNLMIKGVDKDGDGFVNLDEFRVMMTGTSVSSN
ncbi:hypothetical protein RND81_01G203000 [Saponaria officinalis]|uniref:EF-hand domain-containing protein n=1 Tax=Saponaria officinalis TaxID=3572 RepID=A0AAW1NH81_SAPOF